MEPLIQSSHHAPRDVSGVANRPCLSRRGWNCGRVREWFRLHHAERDGYFVRLIVLLLASLTAASASATEPPITAAAFAPNGTSILVGSQRGIAVLSWPELKQTSPLPTTLAHVNDLRFSPDGTQLAAVGGSPTESGGIEIYGWPAAKLLHRETIGEDIIYQVSWREDGKVLATAGPDLAIHLLDESAKGIRGFAGHSREVTTIAMLPGGYFVSGSRDQTLRVWREETGELVRTLNNHTNAVHDVAVRPGSMNAPYVLASAAADKTVRLWWPVRGRLMRFAKLPSPALDICWTKDGTALLAACADGHLRIIDPDTVQISADIEVADRWLYTVAAAAHTGQAFVGGSNGVVKAVEQGQR